MSLRTMMITSEKAITTATRQLEAIRDEWLAPLVDRIGALEREAGALSAKLEQAQMHAEIAALEREQIQAERDELQRRVDALEARQRSARETTVLRTIQRDHTPETVTQRAWWRFWERS